MYFLWYTKRVSLRYVIELNASNDYTNFIQVCCNHDLWFKVGWTNGFNEGWTGFPKIQAPEERREKNFTLWVTVKISQPGDMTSGVWLLLTYTVVLYVANPHICKVFLRYTFSLSLSRNSGFSVESQERIIIYSQNSFIVWYGVRLESIPKFYIYLRTLIVHIFVQSWLVFLSFKENVLFISFYICIPPYPTNVVYASITDYVSSHRVIFSINRLILHIWSLIYTFVSTEI
jgi:hypothetical protein